MPCFVPENKHSHRTAKSTAENREEKQHLFGYSPRAELCLKLIYSVKNKGNKRYCTEGCKLAKLEVVL